MSLEVKDKIAQQTVLKVAPFKKEIRKTSPHKHNNYLEVVYLSKGGGLHCVDTVQYPIAPPTIFIIRKEQVHYWDISGEPEGYVLILKKAFIDKSLDNAIGGLVTRLSSVSCLQVENAKTIDSLFHLLTIECTGKIQYNTPIIEGLLKVLLAKILEGIKPIPNTKALHTDLFLSFKEHLIQNTELRNNVAYYAQKLNTTPQNLNAVCRKSANQSATEYISEYLIDEAKRLLIYTNMTVSEIAAKFDFHDTSHFVKYFKRFTELTPQQFRNTN